MAEHDPPYWHGHFCVHWVDSTADAPPADDQDADGVPDYVETTASSSSRPMSTRTSSSAGARPGPHGARGCPASAAFCMNRTEVYSRTSAAARCTAMPRLIPGSAPSSSRRSWCWTTTSRRASSGSTAGNSLPPLQVTAAHEYNHVLQFAYDIAQDTWMFEATATWMEDEVFTEVDDYRQYLEIWANFTDAAMTAPSRAAVRSARSVRSERLEPLLDARFGPDVLRNAWELSRTTTTKSFAPAAYDGSAARPRVELQEAFAQVTLTRRSGVSSNSPFEEGSAFPAWAAPQRLAPARVSLGSRTCSTTPATSRQHVAHDRRLAPEAVSRCRAAAPRWPSWGATVMR